MSTDYQGESVRVLSALYYPFSRCINEASLKQMLLVFEKLTFLDPVDDESWRATLYKQLEDAEDQRFRKYRDLYSVIQDLLKEGVLARCDPEDIPSVVGATAAASALSDIMDPDWVALASKPSEYGLPHRSFAAEGGPTWQAFLSKLPLEFVNALYRDAELRHHIVHPGTASASWTLTYAAGSAAATSVHLAAAEDLRLAPVTDSTLHHRLLLSKLVRSQRASADAQPLSDAVIRQLTHSISLALVSDLLPASRLAQTSFSDILSFRDKSRSLRTQFVSDVSTRLAALKEVPAETHLAVTAARVRQELEGELREFRGEMRSVRDRIWPALASAANTSVASGGLAAVAMSYIGGPGYALAASIAAASLALLKSGLDLRAERRKVETSSAPGVSYLSTIEAALT